MVLYFLKHELFISARTSLAASFVKNQRPRVILHSCLEMNHPWNMLLPKATSHSFFAAWQLQSRAKVGKKSFKHVHVLMISKYVKGTHLDKMCLWPMKRLAKGQKTTRKNFCYPKTMIKPEPFLTRYPRNEMGAHPFTLQTLRHGINGVLHWQCLAQLRTLQN